MITARSQILLPTLAASLLMLVLAGASPAGANELTVFGCHDPAGGAVGHDGWVNQRTADTNMVAADSCAAGGGGYLGLELQPNFAGYGDAARTEWVFQAPAWSSIASYTLNLAGSYGMPGIGNGIGQAFVSASDEGDPNYDYRNLGAAEQGAWVLSRSPSAPVSSITLNASCDGQSGRCPANTRISALELSAAKIVLRDPTSPTVAALSGGMLPGASVRGTGEADFNASDDGPGIYSAQLVLDGAPQPAVLLDSNGGWCRDLGQTSDGTRSFAHPVPCMQSLSGSVSLDTTTVADGEHTIRLLVEDASGNTTTAFNGTITTHNAPVSSAAPAIAPPGPISVGSTLSASSGAWSDPAAAGSISYGEQWQDCDPHGGECASIPGAVSGSYTITPADAGHTLRVLVTASDRDGVASAASTTTVTVPAPPAAPLLATRGAPNGSGAADDANVHFSRAPARSRGFAQSALTLAGSLTAADGHAIAGAVLDVLESSGASPRLVARVLTAADGAFTARIPPGPSRTVLIGYRAYGNDPFYAASAAVREAVLAGVRLAVTPRRTGPAGTIVLAGRVLGNVPRSGVIVELLVRYRGVWEPFRTPRTDGHGRFTVRYQFQGATGVFPFRAEVPGGQAAFPYADGLSRVVRVISG